ncbi:MAG: hypothetical protein KDB00_02100 [Planctomycetales bacterium]|nr:hypothetical protein [Planctomycetales bacterium]
MRHLRVTYLATFLALVLYGTALSQTIQVDEGANTIRLEVFVRSDRESSDEVKAYIEVLKSRTKGLDVQLTDVLEDKPALVRLYELSKRAGRDKPVLPAFHACDRMYFGFGGAQQSGPAIEQLFTANLYTRSTCPRCQSLKAFLPKLQRRWPAIKFVIHDVDQSSSALETWHKLCQTAGSPPGLPTIDFARRILIGYQGDDVTGAQLEELIRQVSGNQPVPTSGMYDATNNDIKYAKSYDRRLQSSAEFVPLSTFLSAMAPSRQVTSDPTDGASKVDDPTIDDPMVIDLPDEADESEIGESGELIETATTDAIELPLFGTLRVSELGMPLFTLAVGLVDGFNPCAMWVLVFLLSVLVNIKDRGKILAIAGTFVVISGLAYFAFMAAWLNVFMLIGFARPVQIALGILAVVIGAINIKDFFAFKKGVSLSIPESQKPRLYQRVRQIVAAKYLSAALAGAVALAIIVNTIELLCTAGLPALYSQVLSMQEYPAWKNYAYLFLYIVAYMLDDTVLVAVVVTTLSHRKLQEREGRWLKLLSGLVILVLGLVMLLRPEWLTLGT